MIVNEGWYNPANNTVIPGPRLFSAQPGIQLPPIAIAPADNSGDGPRIGFAVRGDGTP
jgi:hypothetical protein